MDVIVNADDLGMRPEVNNAIFDLMRRGKVTSATILANSPFVEEACSQISRFPQCSFGAHLNVTEYEPLSGSNGLERLLDSGGVFDQPRIRQIPIDSSLSQGIYEEFCAQIERLQSLGVNISHVDSHHYVLNIAKMLPILKKVQKRFRIRKVRITRNIYADGLLTKLGLTPHALGVDPQLGDRDVSRAVRVKKLAYNWVLRHHVHTDTTDGFSGFRLFYECAKTRPLKHRSFEVNVHPANAYYDAGELDILEGPWSEDVIIPIRLISYHELG